MASTDKVDAPVSLTVITSPSSSSCSHCGSLFIHSKGCRYCLPSKNRQNASLSTNNKIRQNPKWNAQRGIVRHCVVPCCVNATGRKPKKNFFFPTIASDRRKLWLRAVGVKTFRPKFAICEDHFELEADVENFTKYKKYPTKWNRLKSTAIPAKFPCREGKGGSYLSHDHIFKDLIRTKGAKKEFPSNFTVSNDGKNQEVVDCKATTLPEASSVEPEKSASQKDMLDFLNGDISNLIAHVQPNICSWDVSVVDVHTPGLSASKDALCPKSGVEVVVVNVDDAESVGNSGSDAEDESETDNEDDSIEKEHGTLKNDGTMTTKPEPISSIASTVDNSVVSKAKDTEVEGEVDGESEDEQNLSRAEPSRAFDEATGVPQLPEHQEIAIDQSSVSNKDVAVEVNHSSDYNQDKLKSFKGQQCIATDIEHGIFDPKSTQEFTNSKQETLESSGVTQKPSPTRGQSSSNDTPSSNIVPTPNDSARSTPVKELIEEKQEPTAVEGETGAQDMESESVSDDPCDKAVATKILKTEKVLEESSASEVEPKLTSGRVSLANCSCVMCGGISDDAEDNSDAEYPSSARNSPKSNETPVVAIKNDDSSKGAAEASHPATGATSPESDQGVEASNPATRATSPESDEGVEASNPATRATSPECDEGVEDNIIGAQAPLLPMKRIVKKVELSDYSDCLTEDDSPETVESDSDSEWAPSEEEAKFVKTRVTRSSTKPTNAELSMRTRSSEKSVSPKKTVNITSESNDELGNSPKNKTSLEVNMNETVASYSLKSGTTYSYKQLYERAESNEETAPTKCSDKVLVVREEGSDEFNDSERMPQSIVDLIENMKTYFDHFFDKLDKLKEKMGKPGASPSSLEDTNQSDGEKNRAAEQYIETLEEDVKMFPALLNVEMAQFVLKCKEHYQKKFDDMSERIKKLRWCANCSFTALFHCCFRAAYCSISCQKKQWNEHRKECDQEKRTLLDPHLRLNPTVMARVKNLNKTKLTISDLEKEQAQRYSEVSKQSKELDGLNKESPMTSLLLEKRNGRNDHYQKTGLITYPPKRKLPHSSPRANGSSGVLEHGAVISDSVDLTTEYEIPAKRKKTFPIANGKTVSKTGVSNKMNGTYLSKLPTNKPHTMNIKLPTQLLSSLSGSASQLNNCTYTVATSAASKASPSGNVLLPKPTNQVVLKFKTVTLPNGDKRLVPAEMPTDQNFTIRTNTSPSTSGSILITRPAKSTYTAQTGFIPLTQVGGSSTQPLFLQQGIDGTLTAVPSPIQSAPPSLTQVPPLPTLTPIPKQGSCSIRTLNDEELNKILNTDHLQSAFDDSYYANTRIRT